MRGGYIPPPRPPYRMRKVRVATKSRDHMPVDVRRKIAQAGEVDLVRRHDLAQHGFNRQHDLHAVRAIRLGKVSHFSNVIIPDHTALAGVARFDDIHHAAAGVLPQEGSTDGGT